MGDRQPTAVAVDRSDDPVIDPTANVIALTEAGNIRQDDLRAANDRLFKVQIEALRAEITLRAEFAKEIRQLESDRLDKIRQVDVLAGNTAAERALVAIQTLATQTTAERETLRSMVANTATTIATQTSETVSQLNLRISQLEKSSYEGAGKQAVADPMMTELIQQVKILTQSGAGTAGEKTGRMSQQQLFMTILALIVALILIGSAVIGIAFAIRKG